MNRKLLAFVCALLLALGVMTLAACKPQTPDPDPAPYDGKAEVPNPMVEYGTVDLAMQAAGVTFVEPTLAEGYAAETIHVINGNVVQVVYYNGTQRINLRVAKSDAGLGDISGDYNTYGETESVDLDSVGITVETRGEGGMISVATWSHGGMDYAASFDPAVSPEELRTIIGGATV